MYLRQDLRPPLEVMEAWPAPNRINPQFRGPTLSIVNITLAVLTSIVVVARIYARSRLPASPGRSVRRGILSNTQLGIDDAFIVLSLMLAVAMTISIQVAQEYFYVGRHIWDAPISLSAPSRLNTWISQFIQIYCAAIVKISILLFYHRLTLNVDRRFTVAIWIGVFYNVAYLVGFTINLLVLCRPIPSYWLSWDVTWLEKRQPFHCDPETWGDVAASIGSGIGDLYAAVIPLFVVRQLRLPPRKLLMLCFLFSLGFFVVAACVVKTCLMIQLINSPDYDYTWHFWTYWIWHMLEVYLSILCACAPAIASLFKKRGKASGHSASTQDLVMLTDRTASDHSNSIDPTKHAFRTTSKVSE